MKILHVWDSGDYDASLPRVTREAVRAVIMKDGVLALIRSSMYGEYKCPGGGVKSGESHTDALVREVREETGLGVIAASIRPYGITKEIRQDAATGGAFVQTSYYYTCETEGALSSTNLDPYEEEAGYALTFVTAAEAAAANAALTGVAGAPWVRREACVLKHISEYLPDVTEMR